MSQTLDPDVLTRAEKRAAARVMLKLLDHWRLDEAQVHTILGLNRETQVLWRAGDAEGWSRETLWRASVLLNIHKALRTLFTEPARGYAWVQQPNEAFGGKSAVAEMQTGDPAALERVRASLAAELGWDVSGSPPAGAPWPY